VLPRPYVYGDPWHAQVLAARTVAIARTTIVRCTRIPPGRRTRCTGPFHSRIPAIAVRLEHVHWDGYVEVAQLPLQGAGPPLAQLACNSMSLARWLWYTPQDGAVGKVPNRTGCYTPPSQPEEVLRRM